MKKRRDPSQKSMGKFYAGIIGLVLGCLIFVVIVGRLGGIFAPVDNKYWLTENQDELVQYTQVEESDDKQQDDIESEPQPDYAGLLLYQIKWGDTLTRISNYSGFGIQELADFNQIDDPNLIYTRRFMVFPVGLDQDIVVDSLDAVQDVLNGNMDVKQLSGTQVRDDVNAYVDIGYFRDAVVALQTEAMSEQTVLDNSVVENSVDNVETSTVN